MVNNEDFSNRLKSVIEYYGESASSFSEKIDVQRSSISHIISGRNKPSLDFILKILNTYPDISLYWLLNGTGKMLGNKNVFDGFPNPKPLNSPVGDVYKNQKKSLSASKNNKEIDRIVIFFSDGTFKNYICNNND
ncbi:MAG: helix-turn-helix domain-containing protein [Flavobacteriaceae bacterium]